IDGAPDRRWIVKEHCQAFPVGEPARADGGVLGVPAVGEALEGLLRSREGRGTRDGSQVRRHGPALFPRHIFETIAHLMDNTPLHLRVRTHRLKSLRQSLQPVDARNKAVDDSTSPSIVPPSARYTAFVCTAPSSRDCTNKASK